MKKSILVLCAVVLLLSGCSANDELVENNSSESTSSSENNISNVQSNSTQSSISNDTSEQNTNYNSGEENNSFDYENSKYYTSPITGATYYYDKESYDVPSFICNVDSKIFKGQTADKIIDNCYMDAIYFATRDELFDDLCYTIEWGNTTDGNLGYCFISRFGGTKVGGDNCEITFRGAWENLNNHSENKKMAEYVKGFDFASSGSHIEIDGYKIDLNGDYYFVKIDNPYADENGKTAIAFGATVENVNAESNYFDVWNTITSPNGEDLFTKDTLFGEDYGLSSMKILTGEVVEGYFGCMYSGDGDYTISFGGINTPKKSFKINVKMSEDKFITFDKADNDSNTPSEEPSIVLTEDYVLSNSTETLTTPSGNIWFDLDGQYVTYIDRWESMNDDEIVAEAYLDMTDILVNTKHGVVNFVWANKDGNFEALGVIATKWNGKILNCSKIVWFGDKYKSLNSNEFADIMYEALQKNIGN